MFAGGLFFSTCAEMRVRMHTRPRIAESDPRGTRGARHRRQGASQDTAPPCAARFDTRLPAIFLLLCVVLTVTRFCTCFRVFFHSQLFALSYTMRMFSSLSGVFGIFVLHCRRRRCWRARAHSHSTPENHGADHQSTSDGAVDGSGRISCTRS